MTEVLRAAFDIDDTLVDTVPAILQHYKNEYGVAVPLDKFYSRDPMVWGVAEHAEAIRRVNVFLTSDEFLHVPPIPEALPVLRDLKNRGYELSMMTGRGDFLQEKTNQWREQYFGDIFDADIVYTNYFDVSGLARTKGEVCHEKDIKVLTDDHADHLASLGAYGIRGILYGEHAHNQLHEEDELIVRASTWQDVGREVVRIMSQYE